MTFNFTPIRFNWISSLSESCPGFTDMPAAIAGIAEEKEDYNYIHMNFDLFCPAVWMVFKFGCCSRFSQRETAPPPHPLKKIPNNMLTSTNWKPSSQMDVSENSGTPKSSILIGFSIINHPFWGTPIFGNTQIHPDDLACIFSLAQPLSTHKQTTDRPWMRTMGCRPEPRGDQDTKSLGFGGLDLGPKIRWKT